MGIVKNLPATFVFAISTLLCECVNRLEGCVWFISSTKKFGKQFERPLDGAVINSIEVRCVFSAIFVDFAKAYLTRFWIKPADKKNWPCVQKETIFGKGENTVSYRKKNEEL